MADRGREDGPRGSGVNEARRGTLRALAPEVQRIARAGLGRHSLAEASLLTEWPSVVGGELAAIARPRRIVFADRRTRREGTLELLVPSAQAARIKHREREVLERVNAFFGYTAVAGLRLLHTAEAPAATNARHTGATSAPDDPDAERAVARRVDGIDKPELRDALTRLGRRVGPRDGD